MKSVEIITTMLLGAICLPCNAETLELFTSTTNPGDSNWDLWQQDQIDSIHEDAIYLGMFDGAGGHSNDQPDSPTDGIVDGVYSTLSMGPGGATISQSLGVSGTNPAEFPNDQRDTRTTALFNLIKLRQLNSNPRGLLSCKFNWSIDYVMPWAGSTTYLQAPTTLYVDIFPADKQEYWNESLDGQERSSTDPNDLQDEFNPNSAGILYAEKIVDLRVDNGPWGSGIQPLTNWYIEQNGVQFYEVDVTEEVRQILAADPDKYADPNTAFIGFTMRTSLDGESVYLSLDATCRLTQNPIPPTLELEVTTYIGDFDANGRVNLSDFSILAQSWLAGAGDENWNAACNLDETGDSESLIDLADAAVFCENWFEGTDL